MAGSGRRCVSARQLGLLLWKNSILKRRSYIGTRVPVFLLIEILWPMILFIILVGLRSNFPPANISDAVFRAFALPSAGALPFLQSALCDFSGLPELNSTDMPQYPDAPVNQFYSLLEKGDVFTSWNDVCSDLEGQLACFSAEARLQSCQQQNPILLNCTLRDPAGFSSFLSQQLGLSDITTTSILGAQFEQTDLLDPVFRRQVPSLPLLPTPFPLPPHLSLAGLLDSLLNGETLKRLVCGNTNALSRFVQLDNTETVKSELCDLSDAQFQLLADELRDQILNNCSADSLADQVEAVQSLSQLQGLAVTQREIADDLPTFSNDSDQFHNLELFLCGQNSSGEAGLANVFRRLTEGDKYRQAQRENQQEQDGSGSGSGDGQRFLSLKILYTPDTPCVRSVIHRANRTFAVAGILVEWSHSIAACSGYLLQNDTRTTITTAVDELVAANQTLPGVTRQDLLDIQYSMNDSNQNNLWTTLQAVHDGAQLLEESLRVADWDIFTPVSSETEMERLSSDYAWQEENQIVIMAGLVFTDIPDSGGEGEGEGEGEGVCAGISQPRLYIRMNSTLVHDTTRYRTRVWRPGPEDGRDNDGQDSWKKVYLKFGFVFIQDMVERALVEEIVADTSGVSRVAVPGVYVEQMPYPCYQEDRFTGAMQFVLPLAMIFAWLFPIAMTIRGIVREKETRLREFMKMMGLSDAVLRTSWFLTSGVILLVSVAGITLLLKVGLILVHSNWLLIALYLLLYAVSMIAYSFLVSIFFNNANLAACVGCLLYFLVFFAHISLLPNQNTLPPALVVLACLWAPLAYGLGASYIVQYELEQQGLQWGNIALTPVPDDAVSVQIVMVMMVVDTVLYMLLVWYIEGVWPGRYGVAKPFYFPFQPSYWLGQRSAAACSKLRHRNERTLEIEEMDLVERGGGGGGGEGGKEEEEGVEGEGMCEEEPSHLPLGIAISHLSKTYSSGLPWKRKKVRAVKDLSLNFYEGQITAFLGHNGAGKTTTMSVLTGLYEPSSGTAKVYGQDIRSHMDEVRGSLGLCPQHNVLFDLLTVREHMLFYGMMRGLGYRHIANTIPRWLSKVGLTAHADKLAMHLSGGMKRKLSILLAFVGESSTIILDEPTSGVDPFARRQIWDFLLRHRDNRTVMLSTHHMDEAEILGDRIAILSQGSLICCGSFEYLRHHYGRGHQLSLVTHTRSSHPLSFVTPSQAGEEHDGAGMSLGGLENTAMITQLIQSLVPNASLEEQRGRELRFLLPLHQARPHTLTLLFSRLETLANEMGVASYGLTACSMEEIFIQLTHKEAAENREDTSDGMVPHPSLLSTVSLDDTMSQDSGERGVDMEEGGEGEGGKDREEVEDTDSVFQEQLLPDDDSLDGLNGNAGYHGETLSGPALWLTQVQALLVKRVIYTRRKLRAYLTQHLLPLSLIVLALFISHQLQAIPNQPALELSPSHFLSVGSENYMFTGGCNDSEPWTFTPDFSLPPEYLEYLQNISNISTAPTSFPPFSLPGNTALSNYTNYANETITNYTLTSPAPSQYLSTLFSPCGVASSLLDPDAACNVTLDTSAFSCLGQPDLQCHSSCGECGDSAHFPTEAPPCFSGVQSGTRVQEVTRGCGLNTEGGSVGMEAAYQTLVSYLLHTKSDFIETRYGGVSFGHVRSEVNETVDGRNLVEGDDWPFLASRQAAKAWYSFKGYHALPSYVNTLSNTILRANLPEEARQSSYGVRTYSHPYKFSELKKLFYAVTERSTFIVNPLAAIFNMGFIAASFVLLLIEERAGKILHLQLVSGMSRAIYWVTIALWDLCTFLIFSAIVLLLYVAFQDEFFSDPAIMPTVLLLFVSFGAAVTPWMYLLSFLFHSPATAYIVLFCLNFFSGFSLLIVDAIIVYLEGQNGDGTYIIPHLLALPFPSYGLSRSLMYMSLDRPLKRVAVSYFDAVLTHPLVDLWPFVLSLWLQALVYTAIIVAIEFSPNLLRYLPSRSHSIPVVTCEDENVQREEGRVTEQGGEGDILTLRELTKVYDRGSCRGKGRVAVNRLHLSMKPSECFGLLGVNGAGKTTTFRMLTGDTNSSLGDALIHGRSVRERGVVQQSVGYCPQVDALTDPLSGRQHLILYSRLRGIPRAKVPSVVEWALQRLDLTPHADKPVSQYSGGNRRRLSAAIALLGAPQLLLLDEPTAGVDPAARQFLWSIIRGVVGAGQSVLLTTHSMAECEALCSRVGIMVNGSFRCLGTPQQLKSRYGDGYRLKLRVSGPLEPIEEFIRQNFTSAVIKERHLNTLVYQLPPTGLKLSEAFGDLERGRETLEIRDYSLSQTTLDDVFIHFASQQSEEAGLDEEGAGLVREGEERRITSHPIYLPDVVASSKGGVKYSALKDTVVIT